MEFALGCDGGATGCRAVLTDRGGRVIGRGEGGPANIMSDREGALANLMAAAGEALGGRAPGAVAAVLGVAGANISGARQWLAPMLPFGRAQVVHDAVTSVAGALGEADGIVAAMGTGSVFSRQTAGEVVNIGGWGLVLGDEGSGAWIGKRFLSHALRAGDGLAPPSPLAAAMVERMGGPAGVVGFARTATAADFAVLVPEVLAATGDAAAEAVLAAAVDEAAQAIAALQRDPALPVVFTGGLGPFYAQRLAGRWPQRPARGTALDGALLLAQRLAREAAC